MQVCLHYRLWDLAIFSRIKISNGYAILSRHDSNCRAAVLNFQTFFCPRRGKREKWEREQGSWTKKFQKQTLCRGKKKHGMSIARSSNLEGFSNILQQLFARWGIVEWLEHPLLMLEVWSSNPGHSISKNTTSLPETKWVYGARCVEPILYWG